MNNTLLLPRPGLSAEILTRLIFAAALAIFVWRAFTAYWAEPNVGLLIFFFTEVFTFGLVIFARLPKQSNRSAYAWLLVAVSLSYVVAIQLSTGQTTVLVPLNITLPFQVFGFGFQLLAKAWLGRSFGLLPEERGLVITGPYRFMRHPIYFGYLLNHVGFLLSHFNGWNLLVLAILYICQILRIKEEEKILQSNPAYHRYMQKTRFRLVPLIY